MKRLLSTAAIVVALSGAAIAEDKTATGAFTKFETDANVDLYASDLLGARIYATEAELGDTIATGGETEWDDLGEINDMVLTKDGEVDVVVLGIGGFLGIGERDVAVDMDQLKIVRDGDDPTDYFLVINASREMIENAPEFMREDVREAAAEIEADIDNAGVETAEKTGELMDKADTEIEQTSAELETQLDTEVETTETN